MSTIKIKTVVTSTKEREIQLPAYFKSKNGLRYVKVVSPTSSIGVSIYDFHITVEKTDGAISLDDLRQTTEEDFYHAAARAMDKLTAALLTDH